MGNIVEFKNVYKSYGKKEVLIDLNVSIPKGKIIGLLGQNGSGKSTMIKLINGLLQPNKGEIKINGMKPSIKTKKIVSYLPERTYLNDWMKVKDILSFFNDFYEDFDMQKSYEMLKSLKIDKNEKLKNMSKGTKEKVQLILVMSRNADLYILDEPIGGVDPAIRNYILKTILNNYNENSTLLIATHLISEIENICDDVLVISDEIHSDIILKNHKHTPFASISKEFRENTITCMAPTKTFNLAGLQSSFLVISNPYYYEVMDKAFSILDIKRNNAFSLVATEAAYNYGEDWLYELIKYIEDNVDFAIDYIKNHIPQLKVKKPEGTYLLWVDFSNLNVDKEDLKNALINKGRIALNDGSSFGIGGDGYYRINLACPRSMVLEGLKRIEFAIKSL